jgi:hypothetical protein
MNLVTLATHNLKRRPIRTGLSILGIGLAVGGALALISLSHSRGCRKKNHASGLSCHGRF